MKTKTAIAWLLILLLIFLVICITGCHPEQSVVMVEKNGDLRGSGVIVAHHEGYYYVLTMGHVVQDVDSLAIDGIPAKVVRTWADQDIVLLRFCPVRQYRVLSFGRAHVGQRIVSCGYVDHGDLVIFITNPGYVTGEFPQHFTFNAGAFPGMSGGPILNEAGQIVGLCEGLKGAWGQALDSMAIGIRAECGEVLVEEELK